MERGFCDGGSGDARIEKRNEVRMRSKDMICMVSFIGDISSLGLLEIGPHNVCCCSFGGRNEARDLVFVR